MSLIAYTPGIDRAHPSLILFAFEQPVLAQRW
jgi:hypothetical protein